MPVDQASLQLLLDSFVAIASERDVETVLEQTVDLGRLSTQAKYGAAVAVDEDGALTHFVHRGLTSAQVEQLPHLPRGHGMLAAVLEDKAPIRLEHLEDDPRSVGFPLGHVPMAAFLGVPISFDDRVLGALYLTKAPGQGTFDESDELFAGALGRQAGTALEGGRLLWEREVEIGERRRAEEAIRLVQAVAVAANQSATVEEALRTSLAEVGRHTGWPVGHVFFPEDQDKLVPADIWYLADPDRFAPFCHATERTVLARGQGLAGRVLEQRRAVAIPDLRREPLSIRGEAAERVGLRSGYAYPVLLGDRVEAVVEFFRFEAGDPDRTMLEVMEILGAQVSRVAERQRAASALHQANAELRAADQIKNDFVSMASHELRTPMTSIIGFASTLRSYWESTGDAEKLEYLEVIERQARRLARLVNDLLAMSRIESGKLGTATASVELSAVLADAVRDLGDQAGQVTIDCPPELVVRVDRDHLVQMVGNFISNALKYGAPPIEMKGVRNGGMVEVRVCDAGPGIPEDFRPRLFEKFAQASTGSGRHSTGTGLGLSIVRGLARANGGEAWYEPLEPTGSCFAVRLPAAEG